MSIFYDSMKKTLDGTGIYNTADGSFISHELKAYEEGFGIFEEEFERLLQDIFIMTASDESLESREILFRPLKADSSVEKRREMLKARYSAQNCDFTADLLCEILIGAGIEGRIAENHEGGILIDVRKRHGVNAEQMLTELESLLPAHLPAFLDLGMTWEMLEELAGTFGEIDTADYSWEEIERMN